MDDRTIAFIGGGNMARSLIGGLLDDGYATARVRVADPDASQRSELATRFGIGVFEDNDAAVRDADAVVLAVKPQVIRPVAEALGPRLRRQQTVVISIAAGVREPDISRWLGGGVPVIRAMPNTPALVRTGASALYANEQVSEAQRELAESLLRAVGITRWIAEERLMDAVTAVSGSGPAYFFLLMELIEDAGTQLGLAPQTARLLTLETALGAARMALESGDSPARLRERVTSPGGTTEAALQTLESAGLPRIVEQAVRAAASRADVLGNMLGSDDS